MLTVDGRQFRDANGNGAVDRYEDWRLPVEVRVADLISRMTLKEPADAINDAGLRRCAERATRR